MFILDTDTLTLIQHQNVHVMQAIDSMNAESIFTTAISAQEQLLGRLSVLNSARTPEKIEFASIALASNIQFLGQLKILPMTALAFERFQTLLRLKLNVAGNDLRIAAIALEAGATVVTRNLRDFQRIPDLNTVDWTQ